MGHRGLLRTPLVAQLVDGEDELVEAALDGGVGALAVASGQSAITLALLNIAKAGDEIVSTGVFKLRNGQAVTVDNKLAPPFKLAPKPENN